MNKRDRLLQKWEEWEAQFPGAFRYPKTPDVDGYEGEGPLTIISFAPSGDRNLELPQAQKYYQLLCHYGIAQSHLMDAYIVPYDNVGELKNDAKQIFLEQIKIVGPMAVLVMDMSSKWDKETRTCQVKGEAPFAWFRTVEWLPEIYPIAPRNLWANADLVVEGGSHLIPCYRIYHYSIMSERGRYSYADVVKWETRLVWVLEDLARMKIPYPLPRPLFSPGSPAVHK
jgi:hypothetical protein